MRKLSIVIVILATVFAYGCNKKDSSNTITSKAIIDNALITEIPADSSGFFVWNLEAESYKEYKNSAWSENDFNVIDKLSENQSAKSKGLIELASKLNLQIQEQVSSLVGFINSPTNAENINAGFLIRTKSESARNNLIASIEKFLTEEKLTVTAASECSATAKSVTNTEKDNSFWYDLYKTTDLIVTSSPDLLKSFLSTPNRGLGQLVDTPTYKTTRQELGDTTGEFITGYIDLSRFKKIFKEQVKNETEQSAELPFTGLSLNQGMQAGPFFNLSLHLDQQTDDATKIKQALSKIGNLASIQNLPADSAITIGLNGRAINNLYAAFSTHLPLDAKSQLFPEQMKNVDTITTAIQSAAPGSMFPGLALVINTTSPEALKTEFKNLLGEAIAAQIGSQMPWQTKAINTLNTDYLLTPFGVGVYLANTDNSLILATSESGLTSVIDTASGKSDNIKSQLPKFVNQQASNEGTIFHFVMHFKKLVKLAQELAGSLAMFTGGEELFDQKELEQLEKLGVIGVTARSNGDTINISSRYGM